MKQTRHLMGMPVTVEIVGATDGTLFDEVYDYFKYIDEKFSTYKEASEISRINRGELSQTDPTKWSDDMQIIFELSEKTKKETAGYFEIKNPKGLYDPSGMVKGWAIWQAGKILEKKGIRNFYIDAGGDIEAHGLNEEGKAWVVGIQDPTSKNVNVLDKDARGIVKVVSVSDRGVATSGTYVRGQHIYDPHKVASAVASGVPDSAPVPITDIVSLTVIGPNIYEADRFATAAFAMGKGGIDFIESLREKYELEGYQIDARGVATMTSGFDQYIVK